MEENQATKYCKNCRRDISESNFVMHEVHCGRNIALCPKCQEPVPRSEMTEHDEDYHKEVECRLCSIKVERSALDDHMGECPKRSKSCDFCELEFPGDELASHTDYCGSRTEPCMLCGQYVMLKEALIHEESGCTLPEPISPPVATDTLNNEDSDVLMTSFTKNELHRMMNLPKPNMPIVRNELKRINRPRVAKIDKNVDKKSNIIEAHLQDGTDIDTDELFASLSVEDEFSLPCEECGNLFPASLLLQHQVHCSQEASSPIGSLLELDNAHAGYTNNSYPDMFHRGEVQYLDNLSTLYPPGGGHMSTFPTGNNVLDDEELLPCEFCDQPVPISSLFYHQIECPLNLTQTPRVMTPVVPPEGAQKWRSTRSHQHDPTDSIEDAPVHEDVGLFEFKSKPSSERKVNTVQTKNLNSETLANRNILYTGSPTKTNLGRGNLGTASGVSFYATRQESANKRKQRLNEFIQNPTQDMPANSSANRQPIYKGKSATNFSLEKFNQSKLLLEASRRPSKAKTSGESSYVPSVQGTRGQRAGASRLTAPSVRPAVLIARSTTNTSSRPLDSEPAPGAQSGAVPKKRGPKSTNAKK